jgi:uncharacterized protein (TIGR03790 family)
VFAAVIAGAVVAACDGETGAPPGAGGGSAGAGGAGGEGGAPIVEPTVSLPETGLRPSQLGVLVNAQDPQSVAIADHYQRARGIPESHVFVLDFAPGASIDPNTFEALWTELEAIVPDSVQAYAITWTQPYQVGCMSATSAFALGYDPMYCTASFPCGPSAYVDYFQSRSVEPYTDHGIRPAMMLAAASVEQAQALIDRGVAADDSRPSGRGYLVRTSQFSNSVRWPQFASSAGSIWTHPDGVAMIYADNSSGEASDVVSGAGDVLFYFTGLDFVPLIETNTYLPGAVADHLTSYGGWVPTSFVMSAIAWLEVGATASYGTVAESCFVTAKFPDVTVMVPQYFRGATVLEAYWKSVAWPGEGLFIGEPLARPWASSDFGWSDGTLTIATTLLEPGHRYELVADDGGGGPAEVVLGDIVIETPQRTTISYGPTTAPHYTLRRAELAE